MRYKTRAERSFIHNAWRDYWQGDLGLFTWIIGVFIGTVLIVAIPICQAEFHTSRVDTEQLRADWEIVRVSRHHREVEAIIGQIAEQNKDIMEARWFNTVPILCWIVPNGWDSLELIDLNPNR